MAEGGRKIASSRHCIETTPEISLRMSRVRQRDTANEMRLRTRLWALGFRYRKNYRPLPGSPDVAFLGSRIAVFVDGEFWHGFDWPRAQHRIVRNRQYWIPKIEANILRDQRVDAELQRMGWIVLRFWSRRVSDDLNGCVDEIVEALEARKVESRAGCRSGAERTYGV